MAADRGRGDSGDVVGDLRWSFSVLSTPRSLGWVAVQQLSLSYNIMFLDYGNLVV